MKFTALLGLCFLFLCTSVSSQEKKAGDFSWEMIDSRLDGHDAELVELRNKIDALQLAIKCPCGRGGKCICPPDSCLCPNCPEHHGKKAATQTADGVKLLGFYSDSCIHCPATKTDCDGLTIEWVNADTDPRAKQYHVTGLPALVRLVDGEKPEKDSHFVGRMGLADQAKRWLGQSTAQAAKPSASDSLRQHLSEEHGLSASRVASMSDSEVKAYHDNAHNSPARKVVVTRPAPRTYSAPSYQSSGRNVTRYGGPTWTWPGNLRQHLESTHGVNTAGLSDSQLRTVHDNLHNARSSGITGGSYARPAMNYTRSYAPSFQPRVMMSYGYSSGGCPGGMCPR